jgi:hypothetical protein
MPTEQSRRLHGLGNVLQRVLEVEQLHQLAEGDRHEKPPRRDYSSGCYPVGNL